jgi:2-amino-4-hydroxy-6-hydroxymethyldihydropteridine diphosphokinase
MDKVYIALGSNLGDRAATLRHAIARIAALPDTRCVAQSTFHHTAPVGGPANQPEYLNAAIAVETQLSPRMLLDALLQIEHQFGRNRSTEARNGPRTLDLDILLFGNQVIHEDHLQVPHPRMAERPFVLDPLAQIAPDVIHPVLHVTIAQLRNQVGIAP